MEDGVEMKAKAKYIVKQKCQQSMLVNHGHNFSISNT